MLAQALLHCCHVLVAGAAERATQRGRVKGRPGGSGTGACTRGARQRGMYPAMCTALVAQQQPSAQAPFALYAASVPPRFPPRVPHLNGSLPLLFTTLLRPKRGKGRVKGQGRSSSSSHASSGLGADCSRGQATQAAATSPCQPAAPVPRAPFPGLCTYWRHFWFLFETNVHTHTAPLTGSTFDALPPALGTRSRRGSAPPT